MAYANREDNLAYQREYYKRPGRKEKILASNKLRRSKLRQLIRDIKLASGCSRCGFNECAEALEFHHKDSSKKAFNIGTGGLNATSLERLEEEIKKCEVLCANCHRRERCACCPKPV